MKVTSNKPFWLVKNGIITSYPSLKEDTETEILIVGGGITGSLIAHQCMHDGYKTMVVDKREIGHGSTSATTSMLQYEIDIPLFKLIEMIGEEGAVASYKACYKAIDELGVLATKIKSNCGYEKKSSLYFASLKKEVSDLKKEFETRKKYDFPVKWLEPEDIEKQFKITHTQGGILSEQGGSIDAFRFTHSLLSYNHNKGLRIYDKTNVKKVNYKKNGVTVYTEHGNVIKAKKIIYCNGYESTEIIKEDFVKLLSTYAIVGERNEEMPSPLNDLLVWNTSDPYMYLRTTDDNRILIGGKDEDFVDTEKRDQLLGKKAATIEKYLNKILPKNNFRVDFAWAGTFGETKDGLPYIGKHPDFPSTYFVLGFGGNGITFSVMGMDIISKMLKGKKVSLAQYFKFGR